MMSSAQNRLDSTLQAAKKATAPTAAKPVKAVERQAVQGVDAEVLQAAAGGAVDQGDELGLVGDQHLDVAQQGQVDLGVHGGGVENRDRAIAPGHAQDVRRGLHFALGLAKHDLGIGERAGRDVTHMQGKIGPEGHHDEVLAGGIDGDAGGAGGLLLLDDESRLDAIGPGKFLGMGTGRILADGAEEQRRDAGARGGDGLVESLAARSGPQLGEHGFAGGRERLHIKSEILDVTADDDDAWFHSQ